MAAKKDAAEKTETLPVPATAQEMGLQTQALETIDFDRMIGAANHLVKSGFLPKAVDTPQKAVAIVLMGRELGIPTMQALRMISVIQGKPTMGAELMLSRAYACIPGFQHTINERTDEQCVITFHAPGRNPYTHTFTMEDAKNLGLAIKDNYKKQPATMLFWRCISGGLRAYVPQVVNNVYTPEEMNPDLRFDPEGAIIVDSVSEPEPAPEPEPEPKNDDEEKMKAAQEKAKKERAAAKKKKAAAKKKEEEEEPVDWTQDHAAKLEHFGEPTGSLLDEAIVKKIEDTFAAKEISLEDLERYRGLFQGEWTDSVKNDLLTLWGLVKEDKFTKEHIEQMCAIPEDF